MALQFIWIDGQPILLNRRHIENAFGQFLMISYDEDKDEDIEELPDTLAEMDSLQKRADLPYTKEHEDFLKNTSEAVLTEFKNNSLKAMKEDFYPKGGKQRNKLFTHFKWDDLPSDFTIADVENRSKWKPLVGVPQETKFEVLEGKEMEFEDYEGGEGRNVSIHIPDPKTHKTTGAVTSLTPEMTITIDDENINRDWLTEHNVDFKPVKTTKPPSNFPSKSYITEFKELSHPDIMGILETLNVPAEREKGQKKIEEAFMKDIFPEFFKKHFPDVMLEKPLTQYEMVMDISLNLKGFGNLPEEEIYELNNEKYTLTDESYKWDYEFDLRKWVLSEKSEEEGIGELSEILAQVDKILNDLKDKASEGGKDILPDQRKILNYAISEEIVTENPEYGKLLLDEQGEPKEKNDPISIKEYLIKLEHNDYRYDTLEEGKMLEYLVSEDIIKENKEDYGKLLLDEEGNPILKDEFLDMELNNLVKVKVKTKLTPKVQFVPATQMEGAGTLTPTIGQARSPKLGHIEDGEFVPATQITPEQEKTGAHVNLARDHYFGDIRDALEELEKGIEDIPAASVEA